MMGDASGKKKQPKSQQKTPQKSRVDGSDATATAAAAATTTKDAKKKLGTKTPAAQAAMPKEASTKSTSESKPATPPLTQRTDEKDAKTSTLPRNNSGSDIQNEQQQQQQQPRQQGASKGSASKARTGSGSSRSTSESKKPTTSFDTSVRVVVSANRWRMKQRMAARQRLAAADAAKAKARADAEADLAGISPSTSPTPEAAQLVHNDDIIPTVNGMRVFGISKGQMQRAIVKFTEPPEKHPLTICFHFPSTFLTHRYVLDMMRSALKKVEGGRVKIIQFIDRNTIHGTQGLDNRWLVTVNKPEAVDCLVEGGFLLYNRRIVIRRYDEILTQEYQEYQDYMEHENRLYTMRKKLVNVAHGESEDVNELRQLMAE